MLWSFDQLFLEIFSCSAAYADPQPDLRRRRNFLRAAKRLLMLKPFRFSGHPERFSWGSGGQAVSSSKFCLQVQSGSLAITAGLSFRPGTRRCVLNRTEAKLVKAHRKTGRLWAWAASLRPWALHGEFRKAHACLRVTIYCPGAPHRVRNGRSIYVHPFMYCPFTTK